MSGIVYLSMLCDACRAESPTLLVPRSCYEPRLIHDSLGRRRTIPSIAELLWRKVDKSAGPEACWPWTGYCNPKGYGHFKPFKPYSLAHVAALVLSTGRHATTGLDTLHRCDNPPCCNPAHLREGTHAENVQDMVQKRRSPRSFGMQNGKAKLTDDQVRQLRARKASGESCRTLGRAFGVSHSYVSKVTSGERRAVA